MNAVRCRFFLLSNVKIILHDGNIEQLYEDGVITQVVAWRQDVVGVVVMSNTINNTTK